MTPDVTKHRQLTVRRMQAFIELFGTAPATVFSYHQLTGNANDPFLIDVFAFPVQSPEGPAVVAVTNGMSDHRMVAPAGPEVRLRRELIQYLPECTPAHAMRLRSMAWLPLFDGFLLDSCHTLAWEWPAVEGTPWQDAFFLDPVVRRHREFEFEVDGDMASLLWHVPISREERAYKREHGADALLDRMDAVKLPLVFDEKNRPSLV